MKPMRLIMLNAAVLVAAGIAFTIYAPLMMAFFGLAELPQGDAILYWQAVSFARMFGAAMLGGGILLWALRPLVENTAFSGQLQRNLLIALLSANLLNAFTAVTQQSIVWQQPIGWAVFGIFLLFAVGYTILLFQGKKK